jgi:uncharacterized SAM-binding protein YcdF (DUF218 family)
MAPELLFRAVCRALVLPPGGCLLLGFAGLLLLRRAPRVGRWLIGTGLVTLLLLSLPVVANLLDAAVERYPPLDLAHPPPVDAIVVLGGGVDRNAAGGEGAQPRGATLERLAYGAKLARLTGQPLLLSGGAVPGGEPEAEAMQRMLQADFGLEARWVETRSRTTRENAQQTALLLAPLKLRHVLLVTSATHMRRSMAEFVAVGLEPVAAPCGGIDRVLGGSLIWLPQMPALAASHAALYELAGEIVAELSGRR